MPQEFRRQHSLRTQRRRETQSQHGQLTSLGLLLQLQNEVVRFRGCLHLFAS